VLKGLQGVRGEIVPSPFTKVCASEAPAKNRNCGKQSPRLKREATS
jgi:hypothetical protein